jgi:predicted site-specific integrase-resolvase
MEEVYPSKNYNTTQVAAILGVSRQTVNNYCKSRILRYGISRANGRKFFKGSEIIRAMGAGL